MIYLQRATYIELDSVLIGINSSTVAELSKSSSFYSRGNKILGERSRDYILEEHNKGH